MKPLEIALAILGGLATILGLVEGVLAPFGMAEVSAIILLLGGPLLLATAAIWAIRRKLSDQSDLPRRARHLRILDTVSITLFALLGLLLGRASRYTLPTGLLISIRAYAAYAHPRPVPADLYLGVGGIVPQFPDQTHPACPVDVVVDFINSSALPRPLIDLRLEALVDTAAHMVPGYVIVDLDSTRSNPVLNLASGAAERHQVRFFVDSATCKPKGKASLTRLRLVAWIAPNRSLTSKWVDSSANLPYLQSHWHSTPPLW